MKITVTIDDDDAQITVSPNNPDFLQRLDDDLVFRQAFEELCDRAKELITEWEDLSC